VESHIVSVLSIFRFLPEFSHHTPWIFFMFRLPDLFEDQLKNLFSQDFVLVSVSIADPVGHDPLEAVLLYDLAHFFKTVDSLLEIFLRYLFQCLVLLQIFD
jgi:hypothetical protein